MHIAADLQDGKERELFQIQVLVVLVFEAVPVLPDMSVHSKLYTQQTLRYHSSPAMNETRINHQQEKIKEKMLSKTLNPSDAS